MAAGPPPVFPPNPNPAADASETTLDAARQNMLVAQTRLRDILNGQLKSTRDALVTWYNEQTAAHRPATLPAAENTWVLVDNGGVDVTIAQTGAPVSSSISLYVPPPPPADGTIDLGADLGAGWYAAGEHDRTRAGTTVTLPNGLTLQKVGGPFGNGWYRVLSGPQSQASTPSNAMAVMFGGAKPTP